MQALPWAWTVTTLYTVALKVMILPLPLSTDAVNGIPSPIQNPIRGTLTVRDIEGEAQHRQQVVLSFSNRTGLISAGTLMLTLLTTWIITETFLLMWRGPFKSFASTV